MPLYEWGCPKCNYTIEAFQSTEIKLDCLKCGSPMERKFPSNIMIKMKGEGGYPSRHKQVFNTTYRKHPKLK